MAKVVVPSPLSAFMLVRHYRNGYLEDRIELVTVDVVPQHGTLPHPCSRLDHSNFLKDNEDVDYRSSPPVPVPIPRTILSRLSPGALQSSTKSAEMEPRR
ncbi:hypothetical protein M378DRAFT_18852 [Amanita muscaria Koide BX008]|uniref:Uncharacterized protein n=1 Tax=Amanita muscaria (strain Koide BX008) TaxID=946122 RepID=A0A0C2SKM2_AMAMK|nr:hypothetical protein M378DRAFT_18852 [Amanita muscaria Koide BX008]